MPWVICSHSIWTLHRYIEFSSLYTHKHFLFSRLSCKHTHACTFLRWNLMDSLSCQTARLKCPLACHQPTPTWEVCIFQRENRSKAQKSCFLFLMIDHSSWGVGGQERWFLSLLISLYYVDILLLIVNLLSEWYKKESLKRRDEL